jgi:hypothetical protein
MEIEKFKRLDNDKNFTSSDKKDIFENVKELLNIKKEVLYNKKEVLGSKKEAKKTNNKESSLLKNYREYSFRGSCQTNNNNYETNGHTYKANNFNDVKYLESLQNNIGKNNNKDNSFENKNNTYENQNCIYLDSLNILGKTAYEIEKRIREIYENGTIIKNKYGIYDFKGKDESYYHFVTEILKHISKEKTDCIKAGMEEARKTGKQIGRNKLSINNIPKDFFDNLSQYENGNITKSKFAELCSCSRPTLNNWLKCYKNS